ncbi:hypothetical protein HRF87_24725 [Bacillus sp. CRN 9]|nr:hypothetical protein [Bacillus sp. CRN 9]
MIAGTGSIQTESSIEMTREVKKSWCRRCSLL